MTKQWILLANSAQAQLYERGDPDQAPLPVESFVHPQSRLKGNALEHDRPGHESSDASSAASRFEPRTEPRHKAHQQFARELAARLEAGLAARSFDSLWLFASSPFFGELKAALSDAVVKRLELAHDSDLTALTPRELKDRLDDPRLRGQ